MKEYEIQFLDLQRMLVGEVPFHFYVEVIFRIALIYLILVISMRLMGKRMSTQLSRNEMAAVASLAAAVGVPLMNPERGVLPAVVIAIVIIGYQYFIARKAATDRDFESLTQDKYNMLVKDGVLNVDAMMLTRISRDRIFSQLRSESVSHLGMVRRLYFEAGGSFSILKAKKPKTGLSILPEWDTELSEHLHAGLGGHEVCHYCGAQKSGHQVKDGHIRCENCKASKWVQPVRSRR